MSNLPHSLRLNYSGFIAALIILLAIWALTTTAWTGHGPDSTGLYCSSETEIWQDLYYTQEDIDNGANPDEFHAPYYDCAQNNQTCESDGQGVAWCAETSPPQAGQCQQDRDFKELIACNGAANHCGYGLFACEGSDELRSRFDESGYCGTYPENPVCEAPPVSPPEPSIEPPPEVEPPSVLPPARVCENTTCIYTRDGACYQGNCLNLERNCGYDDNCGPVEGCSSNPTPVQCPDSVIIPSGTTIATPIISSLTVSANPPISSSNIPNNTLITVTANMVNNTATRFEWFINGDKLENQTGSSIEYRVQYNLTPQLTIRVLAYNNLGVASEPKQLSLVVQPPQSATRSSAPPPEITSLRITNNQTGAAINLGGATIESGTELKLEATIQSNDPTASVDCRWYFHNEQSSGSPPPRQGGCTHVEIFTEADSKVSLVPVHVYTDSEVPGSERVINFTVKPPSDIVQTIIDRWGIWVDPSFGGQHLRWMYEFFSKAERTRFMDLARGERIANCGGCIPNQIQGYVQMSQHGKYTDREEFIPTLTHEMGHGIYWRHLFGAGQAGWHFNLYGEWGVVSSYPRARFDVTENYPEVIAGCLHGKGVGTIYQAVWPHYKKFANSLIGQCVI